MHTGRAYALCTLGVTQRCLSLRIVIDTPLRPVRAAHDTPEDSVHGRAQHTTRGPGNTRGCYPAPTAWTPTDRRRRDLAGLRPPPPLSTRTRLPQAPAARTTARACPAAASPCAIGRSRRPTRGWLTKSAAHVVAGHRRPARPRHDPSSQPTRAQPKPARSTTTQRTAPRLVLRARSSHRLERCSTPLTYPPHARLAEYTHLTTPLRRYP